jgi:hypothetical protein
VNRTLYILSIDAFCVNSELYIFFNIDPNEEYRFWSVSESYTNSVEKEVEYIGTSAALFSFAYGVRDVLKNPKSSSFNFQERK